MNATRSASTRLHLARVRVLATGAILSLPCHMVAAQEAVSFVDEFNAESLSADWTTMTGDGDAKLRFSQADGIAEIHVDARADQRNIWWALIRHPVTPWVNVRELQRPDRELRVEARVRTDTAPRRINLHVNHSRTTDFHAHLREYDLPETGNWQVLSMTTEGFDARTGDEVFVQLALMDWGLREYRLDVDYIKVTVVDPAGAGDDLGRPLPYRPVPEGSESYTHALPAAVTASIDPARPGANGSWRSATGTSDDGRLVAGPSQAIVLRWDLSRLPAGRIARWGILEVVTDAVYLQQTDLESHAELRIAELLNGAPANVDINEQPVIDIAPLPEPGARTRIPVSPPVLERLLSGRSNGLAISSHGGILAVFRNGGTDTPVLYFDISNPPSSRGDKEDDDER